MKKKEAQTVSFEALDAKTEKMVKAILANLGPRTGRELFFLRDHFKARQVDLAQWVGFSQAAISQMEKSGESTTTPLPVWYALHCYFAKQAKKEIISYEKYLLKAKDKS